MLLHLRLAALSVTIGGAAMTPLQTDPNYIVNGGFENGLKGWKADGDAEIEKQHLLASDQSIRLGFGKASVSQRYKVPGQRILEFGATAKFSTTNETAIVRVRCLDSRGRTVMDLSQPFDAKKATESKGVGTGIYFKTQALTASVVVSIEKTMPSKGYVSVSKVVLHDYDLNRKEHSPLCDLEQYMHPVWKGETVFDETVLLLAENNRPPSGKLMFDPTRILSVRDSALQTEFLNGKDFSVSGNEIRALPGSKIPSMKTSDFPAGDFPWLSVAGKHIKVTYTHDDRWSGPSPVYRGDQLPGTTAKLVARNPLTIVALGDSITLGMNVSGYRSEPPFMPTWPELFMDRLKTAYHTKSVKLYNAALGGMTAQWGKDNAKDAVASLNPDLVLVAFGMNDFWSVSPDEFRANIASIIQIVRARRPKAEFILVSSIRFDPAYTKDPVYVGHLTSYQSELKSLVGDGILLLDLTALSDYMYQVKTAKDLLADPMHPDDFFARLIAQTLFAMFEPRSESRKTR